MGAVSVRGRGANVLPPEKISSRESKLERGTFGGLMLRWADANLCGSYVERRDGPDERFMVFTHREPRPAFGRKTRQKTRADVLGYRLD